MLVSRPARAMVLVNLGAARLGLWCSVLLVTLCVMLTILVLASICSSCSDDCFLDRLVFSMLFLCCRVRLSLVSVKLLSADVIVVSCL